MNPAFLLRLAILLSAGLPSCTLPRLLLSRAVRRLPRTFNMHPAERAEPFCFDSSPKDRSSCVLFHNSNRPQRSGRFLPQKPPQKLSFLFESWRHAHTIPVATSHQIYLSSFASSLRLFAATLPLSSSAPITGFLLPLWFLFPLSHRCRTDSNAAPVSLFAAGVQTPYFSHTSANASGPTVIRHRSLALRSWRPQPV